MRNKTVQVISPHSWESTERSCFSQSVAIMGERSLGDDRPNGLSQFLAVIFVMGAVAGIGVLALPHAMTQTGWTGAAVIVMCALVSGYCGSRLGTCWTILEERWLEYKGSSRNPYPTIAYRACGPWMRTATSVIQLVGLFGYGAVFVLLAGELVMDVTRQLSHDAVHLSFCYWLMLIAIPLAVLMWLGSPKDFGFAALGALGATLLATCIVVGVCGTRMTSGKGLGTMQGKITVGGFFRGFGTIMFSYGGAAMFPTIQNDMKSRRKFPTAVIYASIVLVVLYLVMSVMGYLTFGSTVRPNILLSIGDGAISIIVQFLFIAHLLCAFLIVINPMCQEFEEHLSLPIEFTWRRVVVRSLLMLAVLFVSETVPHFGKVLPLAGSLLVGLTTFIMPCLFYYRLCSDVRPEWPDRSLPLWEKALLIEISVMGVIGTCAGTMASIQDLLSPGSFALPCFLDTNVVI